MAVKLGASTKISRNNFQNFKRAVIGDVKGINGQSAQVQVAEQSRLVPVQTGALKSTIRIEQEGDVISVVEGTSEIDYALYQEYGTENQPGTPHIRPAHAKAVQYRDRELAKLRGKY